MSIEEQEQRLRQIQRQYVGFFDDGEADGTYEKAVTELIAQKDKRLNVNINDLRKALPERAQNILVDAFDEIVAIQRALKEYVGTIDPSYAKETKDFFVGFEGSFGSRHLTSRTLTSRFINNLVCVEGIVTKVSLVRPKVVTSVHYCPNTAKSISRGYSDLTSLEGPPTSAAYPTQDEDGNPLQTEFGLSTYKDHQTLSIQELPEKAPTGMFFGFIRDCLSCIISISKIPKLFWSFKGKLLVFSKRRTFLNCTSGIYCVFSFHIIT